MKLSDMFYTAFSNKNKTVFPDKASIFEGLNAENSPLSQITATDKTNKKYKASVTRDGKFHGDDQSWKALRISDLVSKLSSGYGSGNMIQIIEDAALKFTSLAYFTFRYQPDIVSACMVAESDSVSEFKSKFLTYTGIELDDSDFELKTHTKASVSDFVLAEVTFKSPFLWDKLQLVQSSPSADFKNFGTVSLEYLNKPSDGLTLLDILYTNIKAQVGDSTVALVDDPDNYIFDYGTSMFSGDAYAYYNNFCGIYNRTKNWGITKLTYRTRFLKDSGWFKFVTLNTPYENISTLGVGLHGVVRNQMAQTWLMIPKGTAKEVILSTYLPEVKFVEGDCNISSSGSADFQYTLNFKNKAMAEETVFVKEIEVNSEG